MMNWGKEDAEEEFKPEWQKLREQLDKILREKQRQEDMENDAKYWMRGD